MVRFSLTSLWLAGALLIGANAAGDDGYPDFRKVKWQIDPRCVLARGDSYDRRVVGDPCIVWDDSVQRWRMFYFASGTSGASTAMALSESAEEIGPGDWQKIGLIRFTNPEALLNSKNWHKWWVVMEARRPNRAARIDGRYRALFVTTETGGVKHIQVASSDVLEGPWTVRPQPILSPDPDRMDGLHCDTPTAFWLEEQQKVLIYYKAYPRLAQKEQPGSPFGSCTVAAWWHPAAELATKGRPVMRPGRSSRDWNRGWTSGAQLLYHKETNRWYSLTSGSPTPPEADSHREPAPSLAGWAAVRGFEGEWAVDNETGPLRYPKDLSPEEIEAGLGVNFWRHHLLVTPGGQVRIFFNSGAYGKEQMYSLAPVDRGKEPQ